MVGSTIQITSPGIIRWFLMDCIKIPFLGEQVYKFGNIGLSISDSIWGLLSFFNRAYVRSCCSDSSSSPPFPRGRNRGSERGSDLPKPTQGWAEKTNPGLSSKPCSLWAPPLTGLMWRALPCFQQHPQGLQGFQMAHKIIQDQKGWWWENKRQSREGRPLGIQGGNAG